MKYLGTALVILIVLTLVVLAFVKMLGIYPIAWATVLAPLWVPVAICGCVIFFALLVSSKSN